MARHRESPEVERRIAETRARLAPEKAARDAKRTRLDDLRGAVLRRRAALDTREEVRAAEQAGPHPDDALVARLRAEREARQTS